MATTADTTGDSDNNCDTNNCDTTNCEDDGGDDEDSDEDSGEDDGDTYRADMRRLTEKLTRTERDIITQLTDLGQERDDRDEELRGIRAEIASVKKAIEGANILLRQQEYTATDIAILESANVEIIENFDSLECSKANAMRRLVVNARTRAKMLGSRVPPKKSESYTSAEIVEYDEKMGRLTRELRINETKISQMRENMNRSTDGLNDKKRTLTIQKRDLVARLDNVCKLQRGTIDLISHTTSQHNRYEKCLVMAEMLGDYEEYLSNNCHNNPRTLWYRIKSNNGPFHENWASGSHTSDADAEIAYFEEFLYTLVGTCNRHRYEYLKDTYVTECLCYNKGWDTSYNDWDYCHEGFRPNDGRCSHGAKMHWVDDDEWRSRGGAWQLSHMTKWSDGVMFSMPYSRELEFTIHSEIPPGHIEI